MRKARTRKKRKRIKKKPYLLYLFLLSVLLFAIIFIFYRPPASVDEPSVRDPKALLSEKEKLEDFNFFYDTLSQHYPYFAIDKTFYGNDFLNNKQNYSKKILNTKDNESYYEELINMTKDFGNEVRFLSKREYDSFLKYENLSSLKLWIDTLKEEKVKNRYASLLISEGVNTIEEELTMTTPIPNEIAYLKITNFDPLKQVEDGEKIKAFISNIGNYHSLIIDIRDNQGISIDYFVENLLVPLSDDYYKSTSTILEKDKQFTQYLLSFESEYFTNSKDILNINDLKKDFDLSKDINSKFEYAHQYSIRVEPNADTGFQGEIYILQNAHTKYAADTFSQFANLTSFATTVGVPTGGNGVNISSIFLSLPNSGFVFTMPVGMGLNSDGSCNYEYGTDPVLHYPDNKNLLNILIEIIQS